ncbi:MAG: DUF4388 domain-containing protein [Candidatus Obscuribacterales bacterium]|nr:DUF4388 domain-containing protein [Candidatus Obscuribacterales bacterium]
MSDVQIKQAETIRLPPRLPSNPTLADIHHYLSKAIENRGVVVDVSWMHPGSASEYSLRVQCSPRGADAEWSMFVIASGKQTLVWTYVSCDVLLVYNLVMSSCGGASQAEHGAGAGAGRVPKTESTFYKIEGLTAPSPAGQAKAEPPNLPPNVPEARMRNRSALTGDIKHVQAPTLLQSILMAQMTGCLAVSLSDNTVEIYFVNGATTHAQSENTVGEETIFELLTWKSGEFHFEPDKRSDANTISQNLDSLLLQGMQLLDYDAYLSNAGLRPSSVLIKQHSNISEKDFETMVGSGAPVQLALQKRFYKAVDGRMTVEQLVSKMHLPRSQWLPVMCNMLRCDLLAIGINKENNTKAPPLEPKSIDKRAIQNVMMSLRRTDTGMFTYPAFLYFLEQEYFRAYRSSSPISIVVFQMRLKGLDSQDPVREPLPLDAVGEAVRRISRVKRHVDLLAHYETFDYALLLPNTKSQGAEVFCRRVIKALTIEPLIDKSVKATLSLAFGSACIPEDATDPALVLSAAEVASNTALRTEQPLVLYRDIK